jgi:hypothetical protein
VKLGGLVVRDAAIGFLTDGGVDLPVSMVRDVAGVEPGRPARLLHPSGTPLGTAVADPENDRVRLFARADEPFTALDAAFFAARVDRALALRAARGQPGEDAADPIIHSAGDGQPRVNADQ